LGWVTEPVFDEENFTSLFLKLFQALVDLFQLCSEC